MEDQILEVITVPLAGGADLTLVRTRHGWRFASWHRGGIGRALPSLPSEADRQRYFTSPEAAALYFARHYAAILGGKSI